MGASDPKSISFSCRNSSFGKNLKRNLTETKISDLLHRYIAVYNSKTLTMAQMYYRRETAK